MPPLDETQRLALADRATALLNELQTVADAAQAKLAPGVRRSMIPIAAGTNPMVDGHGALQTISVAVSSVRSALERIAREPFIARVILRWEREDGVFGRQALYVTRPS